MAKLAVPVLHVTDDMAALSGGVPSVVRQLATRWAQSGQRSTVLYANGDASDLQPGVRVVKRRPAGWARVWGHSPGLRDAASALMADVGRDGGVVHIHGLWTAMPTLTARSAQRLALPSVFTAHGMLVPWLWTQQGLLVRSKKLLFWHLLAAPGLRRCRVVHAITPMERDELAMLLPGSNIVVIPNAIDIDPVAEATAGREPVILFLGRIEPKKGVDILIHAFAKAGLPSHWRLHIVGPSWSDNYLAELKAIVNQVGLESRIRFLGPVFGQDKQALLDSAWVLAAPSHSEVVGLVNLEAAARQLPSITTRQTGLFDWEEGGGLLVEPTVDDVTAGLRQAAAWSDAERQQRGVASHALVARRYSWVSVMPMWRDLYTSIGQLG